MARALNSFPDAEDGTLCALNTATWVARVGPLAVRAALDAALPPAAPLPRSPLPRAPAAALEAVAAHQDAVTAGLVARQAGREALWRQLLARETAAWRAAQLAAACEAERGAALAALKRTTAEFRAVYEEQRARLLAGSEGVGSRAGGRSVIVGGNSGSGSGFAAGASGGASRAPDATRHAGASRRAL